MTARRYASVVLVVLLVLSSGGMAYAGGQADVAAIADTDGTTGPVTDELVTQLDDGGEADDVYVDRSGDAVFRYEDDHDVTGVPIAGELGVDAGTGLVHALYTGDLERVTLSDRDVRGNATTWATAESVTSTGAVVVDDPDDVRSLSADLHHVRTAETESSSLDVDATVTNDTQPYETVETEGALETTATTIETEGTMQTTVSNDGNEGSAVLDAQRELTLTETEGTIHLQVSETRTVGEWERERWASESDARASLENQYDEVAIPLGGDASLTLESYAFEDDGSSGTLELAYTVTFEDVREGLADALTRELRDDTDLDEHEARVIADRFVTTSIEEVRVNATQRGLETDLEWDIELYDTGTLRLGLVEIARSSDRVADSWAGRYEEAETALEAEQEAQLRRQTSWNSSVVHDPDTERTSVDTVVESSAENWERYGTARADRGMDPVPETRASLAAAYADGDLETQYDYETETGGAGTAALEQALRFGASDLGPMIDVAIAAIDDEIRVTRIDTTVDDGTVAFESAAALADGTSLESAATRSGETTAIHAVTASDRTDVYVTIEAAFDGGPTADEIRDHPRVGSETTVYEPGEWDRDLPSIDVADVETFLEVTDRTTESSTDSTAVPPVPALVGGVGVVALVVSSLFWLPWRRIPGP